MPHHIKRQVTETAIAAEAALMAALTNLIVFVNEGYHLIAVPAVPGGRVQAPVAEHGEIIRRVKCSP